MQILSQAIQATKRMRILLLFVALLYVGSYLTGWYQISVESSGTVETAQRTLGSILTGTPFTTILQSLQRGELVQAVVITFLFNLASGAFLTTTLPGVIPLVGALGTISIALLRGFIIGMIYPEILASSVTGFVVGMGTVILELGAYVFSGAAGIYISLAPLMPRRHGVQSRWAAFKMAWKDTARIYLIVVILLALGAIWEMTGIFLSLHRT